MSAEEIARENGWVPKEEWEEQGKDGSKWRPAEEFNERGEMIGRFKKAEAANRALEQKLTQTNAALEKLSQMQDGIAKRERDAARAELLDAKKAAIKEGDGEAVVEIDEQLETLKEEERKQATETPKETPPEEDPEVIAFGQQYPEFETNKLLGGALTGAVQDEMQKNPNRSRGELLEAALETVKEQLPQYFEEEEPASTIKRTSKVSETTKKRAKAPAGAKTTATAADLDDDLKAIGNTLVKSGAFKSLDEYAKELRELGEI